MSKQELSFYVIQKPDDAFDRAWASAAATPTPPKPDEGLWTDRKLAATYKGDGWVSVLVNPDPNKLPAHRSGQLFAFEITANESLAPMRFTTRLRGEIVTSMPTRAMRGCGDDERKGETPKDEQQRHQLLLDSPGIEMTYLGKRAHTLDDPVSNPFRQTYLLPKRGLCSCGSGLLLPTSCADGRVQVRYWFEIVGQRLNSSESRLRWKGKNRLSDVDERQSAQVLAIPVRITSERYSPRSIPFPDEFSMVGAKRNETPVSVSQRDDETQTTRYFLEEEGPKLAGFDVSSLKLVHRITTPDEGPASLHVRLEVSLGIYQHGPRYRGLCDSFAKTQLSVTFRLVRQTTIIPPEPNPKLEPEDRKGRGKAQVQTTSLPYGVTVSPFVESGTFITPLRVDKPYISTDLRLVGPPGVKERAQELFLKFDGDLVFESGATICGRSNGEGSQSGLPARVQACNAEVRYDLIADLTDPSAPSTTSIRAEDVRIDLPASLLTGLQRQSRPPVSTPASETFPTRMLSIAREADLVAPGQYEWMSGLSSETLAIAIPASTSARAGPSPRSQAAAESDGAQLPAYEPSTLSSSASPAAADHRDEKRRAGTAATDVTGESEPVPPPDYVASRESIAGHAGETASSSSARNDPGGRFSRLLSSFGRASAAQAETATARRALVVSAPMPPPPTSPAPNPEPEQEAPPPSWEDTVRDDAIEDWVAASLAIGTDDPLRLPNR